MKAFDALYGICDTSQKASLFSLISCLLGLFDDFPKWYAHAFGEIIESSGGRLPFSAFDHSDGLSAYTTLL